MYAVRVREFVNKKTLVNLVQLEATGRHKGLQGLAVGGSFLFKEIKPAPVITIFQCASGQRLPYTVVRRVGNGGLDPSFFHLDCIATLLESFINF